MVAVHADAGALMDINYRDIHAGDEIVIGALAGVRFWTYRFSPLVITSWQHYIDWPTGGVAESNGVPTIENERGLNVYKTIADAMRGGADAIDAVILNAEGWDRWETGIILGDVEFWGATVEHEFGYHAQFVRPVRFLQAWGYRRTEIVRDLNSLWFGGHIDERASR